MTNLLNALTLQEEKRFFGFIIKPNTVYGKKNDIYKMIKCEKLISQLEKEIKTHKTFDLEFFN